MKVVKIFMLLLCISCMRIKQKTEEAWHPNPISFYNSGLVKDTSFRKVYRVQTEIKYTGDYYALYENLVFVETNENLKVIESNELRKAKRWLKNKQKLRSK